MNLACLGAKRGTAVAVFVPFAIFYMKQPPKLDFLRAGLCLVAAAYFMFRNN